MKAKSKKQIESDILSKYLIYGGHLNTQDLLEKEAKHFYNYLNKNTDPGKTIPRLMWEFAETRTWWEGHGEHNAGNLKALERAFICIYFYGIDFLKTVASSPEREREKIYEQYRRQQSKLSKQASQEQLREIDYWSEERDKIMPTKILNNQENREWLKNTKSVHVNYHKKAWGFKTCEASDCIQLISLEDKRKYCSEKCKGKTKSRKWREANPEKKKELNRRYLNDLKCNRLKKRGKSK